MPDKPRGKNIRIEKFQLLFNPANVFKLKTTGIN